MTSRKGEFSRSRLNREFPHQIILPADRCTGEKGSIMESFCKDLTLGPRLPSQFHRDQWHLVYCFAEAAHAELFREKFGGKTFNPETRGRGRNWHLLLSPTICRKG